MATVKRKVASFFIRHVPDFGIIVGNEGESVEVPEELAQELEDEGLIKKGAAKKGADPLDHDGDGRKGGVAPAVETETGDTAP